MTDYKDLNLGREALDEQILNFLNTSGYEAEGGIQISKRGKRVEFGAVGAQFATVDFLLNNKGTTTIQWKMGQNQPLGEKLAIHLSLRA
jgi:hypothetical protein